ncbi:hypothetical protein ABPG75_012570 [Micractinium tetrahymenae]
MASQAAPSEVWWQEVAAAAAAAGRGKEHILPLGTCRTEYDEEDGEPLPPSLEALRKIPVLFRPCPVEQLFQEVADELGMVGRDDEDDPFRMLNTARSYEGQDILGGQLGEVERLLRKKAWPEALTRLAAVMVAARRDPFWFRDTDAPEEVVGIMSKMQGQWRRLLKRSDEELGGVGEQGRQAVQSALKAFQEEVQQFC